MLSVSKYAYIYDHQSPHLVISFIVLNALFEFVRLCQTYSWSKTCSSSSNKFFDQKLFDFISHVIYALERSEKAGFFMYNQISRARY